MDKAAIEDAKRAYAAGEAAYRAGDYKNAIQNFRDAQAIVPTPQAAYWLALSLKSDGQVPEAIAELKALLASSAAQQKLGEEKVATATAALDELNRTPGVITLATEPAGATIGVDGEVRPGVSPQAVELTPGTHTLTVSLPGYQSVEFELDVPPGSKGEQKLPLIALPPPPPAPATDAGAPAAPQQVVLHPTGATPERASRTGTYVVFGVAAAGLVTGTVFGIMALSEKDDSKSKGANHLDRDTLISEVALGAALTFGIAGVVMATSSDDLPTGGEARDVASNAARQRFVMAPYASRDGGGAAALLRF